MSLFTRFPVLRASCISTVSFAISDTTVQVYTILNNKNNTSHNNNNNNNINNNNNTLEQNQEKEYETHWFDKIRASFDPMRTARFTITGALLHGPFFFYGFRMLDRVVGKGQTLKFAATKALLGHSTLFPTFIVSLYGCLSLLQNHSFEQYKAVLVEKAPTTFIYGSCFWPFVNLANFMFVPLSNRLIVLNISNFVWNCVLSVIATSSSQLTNSNDVLNNSVVTAVLPKEMATTIG